MATKCPFCKHRVSLHSEPTATGYADDDDLLAEDYRAGQCGEHVKGKPCPCPGWYQGFSPDELEHATQLARATRAPWAGTIDEAAAKFRELLRDLDASIRRMDHAKARLRALACEHLAVRVNGGTSWGVVCEDGGGGPLERLTREVDGVVPLWGQQGSFILDNVAGCRVRVEMDGIFGVCFPAFSIHAVDWRKPFISSTGYRSFLVGSHDFEGMGYDGGPDVWARGVLDAYMAVDKDHEGKQRGKKPRPRPLERIEAEYVKRHAKDEPAAPPVDAGPVEPVDINGIAAAQTRAIARSRDAALADVPFSLTHTTHDDKPQQGRLF